VSIVESDAASEELLVTVVVPHRLSLVAVAAVERSRLRRLRSIPLLLRSVLERIARSQSLSMKSPMGLRTRTEM